MNSVVHVLLGLGLFSQTHVRWFWYALVKELEPKGSVYLAQLNWLKYAGLRKFNVIPNYMLLVYVFIHDPLRLYLTCISSVLRKPKNHIFGPCPPLNHISNFILLNEPSITWAGIGHYLIFLNSFTKRQSRAKPVLCLSLMSILWELFLFIW